MTDNDRLGLPSASGMRGYQLCAGRFGLEKEAGRLGQEANVSNRDAESGTRIHTALQKGSKDGLSDKEAEVYDFLMERANDQIARIFGDQKVTIEREKRLWLKPFARSKDVQDRT